MMIDVGCKYSIRAYFAVCYILICFFNPLSASAQVTSSPQTVTIRVGEHQDFLRIVFDTPEGLIKDASVKLTENNTIKVDFQANVSIETSQKTIIKADKFYEVFKGVSIFPKEKGCLIALLNISDIKVSKLLSQPRIVIDVYSKPYSNSHEDNKVQEDNKPAQSFSEGSASEIFVVDAGHGGYDSGIRFENSVEKSLALAVANEISNVLIKRGKKVFLIRKSDQQVSLAKRIRLANSKSPAFLISIHASTKDEFAIYTFNRSAALKKGEPGDESKGKIPVSGIADKVANEIRKNLKKETGLNTKHEILPLTLLTQVGAEALLIELPNPEKFGYDKKNNEKIAAAIVNGLLYLHKDKALVEN